MKELIRNINPHSVHISLICLFSTILIVVLSMLRFPYTLAYAKDLQKYSIKDVQKVCDTQICQDGDIFDSSLLLFDANGNFYKYSVSEFICETIGKIEKKDVMKPHCNSVSFSNDYFLESDKYPALYCNVYNNYWDFEDKKLGTCCVYRIMDNKCILKQVIKVGFVDDPNIWSSPDGYRPYGNFVVDGSNHILYIYTIIDSSKTVRFFKVNLPMLDSGVYDSEFDCKVVTINKSDIIKQFDIPFYSGIQGGCFYKGYIISLEGFNGNGKIRIINCESGELVSEFNVSDYFSDYEPESISVKDGVFYYGNINGELYTFKLNIDLESEETHSGSENIFVAVNRMIISARSYFVKEALKLAMNGIF